MTKKIIMVLMSMFLLFGVTSCTQPASQPAQEEVKQEEKDKGIWITDEDVVDMFPQLKEVREYLLDNYPLTREEQKISRTEDSNLLPIEFYYVDRVADGKYEKRIATHLSFEKSVTKKQMVEAIDYVSEKMKEILSEDDEITVRVVAFVGYTEKGILQENLWLKTEAFSIVYKRNAPDEAIWKTRVAPDEWIPFDPASVKEGEKPKYIVEKPTEVEGAGEAKLSELKAYLSSTGVEEFSFEKEDGIYISTGIDPTKTYGYTAIIKSDKETIQEVTYTVTKKENFTDNEYLKLCKTYLITGATFGYIGVNKDEATNFIEDNIETVITTGIAKAQTIGTLSFMITYVNNTTSLIILNPNEQYDPISVKEPEQPQEEAPKEEPAPAPTGLGGVKLSELKDYLGNADVEEFSFEEEDGIYTSTGIDPTKTYGYTAVAGSDKETLQGVVYMITRKENLTDDQYLELCEMYLTAGVTFGYEGVDTDEVTSFIENNMETVLATGESKTQTFGSLSFTITYADNTASLIILNPNEQ